MGLTLNPLTGSNTYRLVFKSTPRRPRRRHGRPSALARDAAAGHLRWNEMPGLQLLVQRLARKRAARDRDPPTVVRF